MLESSVVNYPASVSTVSLSLYMLQVNTNRVVRLSLE